MASYLQQNNYKPIKNANWILLIDVYKHYKLMQQSRLKISDCISGISLMIECMLFKNVKNLIADYPTLFIGNGPDLGFVKIDG